MVLKRGHKGGGCSVRGKSGSARAAKGKKMERKKLRNRGKKPGTPKKGTQRGLLGTEGIP